jgi:protein-disulfide isomerase
MNTRVETKMKRRTLLTAGGSSILTLGLGNFALNRSGEQSSLMIGAANAQTVSDTLPDVVAMVIGDPDAPIHMLEYSSFTCPH